MNKEPKIKLTQYSSGAGWACKIGAKDLTQVLSKLNSFNINKSIGFETFDDCSIYPINDKQSIIQSVDFFTPIVDDPYLFGQIAATNALSDIYAMGGKPLFALNIVGFPTEKLELDIRVQNLYFRNVIRTFANKIARLFFRKKFKLNTNQTII